MKILSLWTAVVTVLVVSVPALAGDPNLARCQTQAEACAQALIVGAFDKLVQQCTHPKIVIGMGGAARMSEAASSERAKMKQEGVDMLAATASAPKELVPVGPELYALVPVTLKFKMADGKYQLQSTFVAWSNDHGKTWKFIDGANLDDQKIKVVLPQFPSARLKIPAPQAPTKL